MTEVFVFIIGFVVAILAVWVLKKIAKRFNWRKIESDPEDTKFRGMPWSIFN